MNTPIATLLGRKASSALHSLPPSATVAAAVLLMNQHKLGSVLVLHGRRIAGIFTERDVLTRVIGSGRHPLTTTLEAVMTREPVTVPPTATVDEAMEIVTARRVRRLPVVDDAGEVIGLISIGDLMRWLVDSHRAEAEHLRDYIGAGATA
jgi:CBS domain-containing protein